MGNLLAAPEVTFEERLADQLCHIAQHYEDVGLICGYIGIFQMVYHHQTAANQTAASESDQHHPHWNVGSGTYDTDQHGNDGGQQQHHHNSSSTRSNLKGFKERKQTQLVVDVDYAQYHAWKNEAEQENKEEPDITDEDQKKKHALVNNSSTNNPFVKFNGSNSNSHSNNINKHEHHDGEKEKRGMNQDKIKQLQQPQHAHHQQREHALQQQRPQQLAQQQHADANVAPIVTMPDIKGMLQSNDIMASVQSLGDTTDQLCNILDRAKVLHKMRDDLSKKIIHIRGNKQTIFSYYLLLNKYIIISYAQYTREDTLSFAEWLEIQNGLEKLEVNLKQIETMLTEEVLKDGSKKH